MSRAKAIELKCKDCIYDNLCKGSWREQVEKCPCRSCPLWEYRPVTIKNQVSRGRTPSAGQPSETIEKTANSSRNHCTEGA